MSDSDDTDILLLIPPNYFIASAEDQLREEELRNHHCHHHHQLQQQQQQLRHCSMERKNEMPADYDDMPAPTAAYQFLHPSKKVELNSINARLHTLNTLEREERGDHHFAAPSDISTISNSTVRTQFGGNNRQQHAFVHSTPKCPPLKDNGNVQLHDKDGMLLEIDHFLEEDQHYNGNTHWKHYSDDYGKPASLEHLGVGPSTELQATSLPCTLNSLPPLSSRQQQPPDSNLISLSEIWGKSGQATAIQVPNNQNALREEQLRRQHLEKTIRALQGRLLEYQQRLSVAIEVDRAKDTALQNAQHEAKSLNQELQQLRETNSLLERQRREHSGKMDSLQLELTHAVNLATKFQEKNDKLEQELSTHTKKTNECSQLYKQQLEELELKVHGYKKSEELALNENAKLRDKLAKAEYQAEKLKLRCDDLEKDNSALKNQKEMLQEFHQKQKSRAEALETQKKSLQETLQHLTENESSLKRKLESQQKALKSHYQQQLENVVSQKLKEFQLQLDKTEETLKQEARERERLIAERSVKQLELINEKNELELNLMAEKYNEEVELYRIQLANASKKIDDLEAKLNFYKSKRADIAEKLHNVMEMQWQKALEILTSPQQQHSRGSQIYDDHDHVSTECNENNELMETPKTTKTSNQQKPNIKENNFNVPSSKETAVPMDKLQAYIELLLSKSPADFEKLDEILSLTSKHKSANGHSSSKSLDKSLGAKRNSAHLKPPWKA